MLMPMEIKPNIKSYLSQTASAAPIAVFRILFGFIMVFSILRFWYNGWIEKLYIDPTFHFKFLGFQWVEVPPPSWCYALFVVCAISALGVALGAFYRLSSIAFFFSFTYIELMDKTTYLNHYYFISVMSFVLIFLPAQRYFSVDAFRNKNIAAEFIPRWTIDAIKILLSIVYIYAGLAKLNYDWMVKAMPLTIWLPTKFNLPLLGSFLHEKWLHYAFSWGGALYDIFIPFLLLWRRTRIWAFMAVAGFHVITRALFPIGMFPFIMIASTLIFFDPSFHQKIIDTLAGWMSIAKHSYKNGISILSTSKRNALSLKIVALVIAMQILIPLRFLAYPGNLFWTEQGYRFSWRVMLMEKTGYAHFKVVDGQTGKSFFVQNDDFLTPFQEKQMATQADFIIEYAHYLADHFKADGHKNIEIYVDSYAALNGRPSQRYIDPNVNLLTVTNSLRNKTYILPLHE